MVTGFFGVPGVGKSTLLVKIALTELNRIKKGKSQYKHVLSNFPIAGCEMVRFEDLGKFEISDSLIIFDEISMDADSRDFKSFPKNVRNFFILHRHFNNKIVYATQDFEKVDKCIRALTFDLWYLSSPVMPVLRNYTIAKRIYRNININEFTSELTMGYRFAKFLEIIFNKCKIAVWRPRYYKYFNSYDKLQLDGLPDYNYKKWSDKIE